MSDTVASWAMLTGKWFVFWSAGVRLALAGVRQFFQPRFTAKEIFCDKQRRRATDRSRIGDRKFRNRDRRGSRTGKAQLRASVAISAAIFYGIAGARHGIASARTRNETVALVSDIFVCVALLAYLVFGAST